MAQRILAQYTVRSKQAYIFRTNRVMEIVGASDIIRNAYKLLFGQARKAGLATEECGDTAQPFDISATKAAFAAGALNMVELFCGGGNDTVLYDSIESYRTANRAYTYAVLKQDPGMIPMCVYTPVTGDYKKDYAALMAAAEQEKNKMVPGRDVAAAPFAMLDRTTLLPMAATMRIKEEQVRLSRESAAKRKAGLRDEKNAKDTAWLDDMITKHGEESLLAVVHADGNNMGAKIQTMLGDNADYDFCVSKMRKFTIDTAQVFEKAGVEAIKQKQAELVAAQQKNGEGNAKTPKQLNARIIIADGDDVTFIANARCVMDYVRAYLDAVGQHEGYSSCAGICIFHSHYPFARAYDMAEQACDNAKKPVHAKAQQAKEQQGEPPEESWVDFHYIHQGIGGDLDEVRTRQSTVNCMARPWRTGAPADAAPAPTDYANLVAIAKLFRAKKVSRGNIKTLAQQWESSRAEGEAELDRVCYNTPGLKAELSSIYPQVEQQMKAIYDFAEVYDLWFAKE